MVSNKNSIIWDWIKNNLEYNKITIKPSKTVIKWIKNKKGLITKK